MVAGFGFGVVAQRWGVTGSVSLIVVIGVLGSIAYTLCQVNHWWGDIFNWLVQTSSAEMAGWFLCVSVLLGALTWLALRRSTI
jgi:preprotein translocase subunit SecY